MATRSSALSILIPTLSSTVLPRERSFVLSLITVSGILVQEVPFDEQLGSYVGPVVLVTKTHKLCPTVPEQLATKVRKIERASNSLLKGFFLLNNVSFQANP